jgi:DNA polymerase V
MGGHGHTPVQYCRTVIRDIPVIKLWINVVPGSVNISIPEFSERFVVDMIDGGGCSAAEPFALQVLGDSMEPEFCDGHVIIVDPGMPVIHGAYVVIEYLGETSLRQFLVQGDKYLIRAINVRYPTIELVKEYMVHGVVVQRAGRRRKEIKHYIGNKASSN